MKSWTKRDHNSREGKFSLSSGLEMFCISSSSWAAELSRIPPGWAAADRPANIITAYIFYIFPALCSLLPSSGKFAATFFSGPSTTMLSISFLHSVHGFQKSEISSTFLSGLIYFKHACQHYYCQYIFLSTLHFVLSCQIAEKFPKTFFFGLEYFIHDCQHL